MSEKIIDKETLTMYEQDQSRYSIIVNRRRAIPEVRDGLKPVQRRVIFAAFKDGLTSPRLRDKSASLVGETMKRYHPHGDCLDPNTVLFCLDGTFHTIKEIYDSKIKSLDILTVDQNSGKIIPGKATDFRICKIDDTEYNIIFSNGSVVKCTGNHPFMLPNGEWVKAENLKPFIRLYQKTILTDNNDRLTIQDTPIHYIVHDYYFGNPGSGYDRHHKNYNYRSPIYKAFDAMIDMGMNLTLDNFYIYNQKRQHTKEFIDDQQIIFLINLYCIERPFIVDIKVIKTEPKEYYDGPFKVQRTDIDIYLSDFQVAAYSGDPTSALYVTKYDYFYDLKDEFVYKICYYLENNDKSKSVLYVSKGTSLTEKNSYNVWGKAEMGQSKTLTGCHCYYKSGKERECTEDDEYPPVEPEPEETPDVEPEENPDEEEIPDNE